jgi:hypothetical protein
VIEARVLTPECGSGFGRAKVIGVQPSAESVATDQRDLAVGRDPVAGAQLADQP